MLTRTVTAKRGRAWLLACVLAPSLVMGAEGQQASSSPAAFEPHFEAAQTYQLAADFDHAQSEYRQGISIALDRVGNLKVSNGEYAAGVELLQRAAATDPKNLDAAIDLGIAQFRQGEYDKAKVTAVAVLKADPTNFRGHNLLGKIHFMESNFQAAADELQSAFTVNPDFDIAYSLALASLQLKKLTQATVLFDEMRASLGKSANLHVLLGQAYRETGYLELAAGEFKNAIELDPHYAHAHAFLGMTYLALGGEQNYDLAREQFHAELAASPHDYSSLYFLGQIELERHNAVQAAAFLQEAHRARPDDTAALLLLGRAKLEEKKEQEAISALRQSIAVSDSETPASQVATAHELLSKAFASAGKPLEAAAEQAAAQQSRATASGRNSVAGQNVHELQTLLAESSRKPVPPDPAEARYVTTVSKALGNAYHNVGVIHARAAQYADAAEAFKQAAKWDPSIAQLDRNWGLAAFRAQLYGDAIQPLDRLLRRSPSDQNVREMLALCYYMTNNFAASAATFKPIANSLPDNAGLLVSAGISFVRTGDTATGERLFARVFATGSATPEIHLMLGQAYAEQSESAQALLEFRRALELNPKLPEAHFFSGMVLFKKGEIEQAAQEFQSELALSPKHAPSMYQLAYIRGQQHQTAEAIQLLSDVIQQQPENSDAHYQLGKALLEQGDVNSAMTELESSVKIRPSDYAYFQLSRAYTRAGRPEAAKEAMANFERLKPKPVGAVSNQ
jgi:tetratricopeptide (TPR) repeat protein